MVCPLPLKKFRVVLTWMLTAFALSLNRLTPVTSSMKVVLLDGYYLAAQLDPTNLDTPLKVNGICLSSDGAPIADGDGISDYTVVNNDANSIVINTPNKVVRGDKIGNATVLVATEVNPVPSGVIKPRFFMPNARVNGTDGMYGYNSTYDLGVLTSTYFTELQTFAVENVTTNWVVGDPVYG